MKLRRGEKDATTAGLDTKLDANLDAAALSRIEWVSRILADRRKDRR